MRFERPDIEALGTALTISRYGIAEHVARRVEADEPVAAGMIASVAADVLDGEILRRVGDRLGSNLDTPWRRIVDGVTDHLCVGRVALEVAKKNESARPYIGILAARAAVIGSLNLAHLATTGEVTRGQRYQKATHLTTAAFGLAAASGNKPLTHVTGIVAAGVAVATTPVHLRELGVARGRVYRDLWTHYRKQETNNITPHNAQTIKSPRQLKRSYQLF